MREFKLVEFADDGLVRLTPVGTRMAGAVRRNDIRGEADRLLHE